MDWTAEDILARLEMHDECQSIEAKSTQIGLGVSVLETISAFANEPDLGGGYLILGLNPNKEKHPIRYEAHGIHEPDRLQQELVGLCRNNFNVQISPEIVLHQVGTNVLLIAYIPEASPRNKPVYIKKKGHERGSYRRIGSADYLCTAEDLDLLFQLRSGTPYERETSSEIYWEDIDSTALETYRKHRKEIDNNATEPNLEDLDLLLSLRCGVLKKGEFIPNRAGLLLFGTKEALRRMMPMESRVDYIICETPKWIGKPSARYHSIDYRESLITLLPRLSAQIMGDLPTQFLLETGQLQRSDIPCVPRDVIREALANALMHRDYRISQPTQIIRYPNRIEFRNAGYSLKPFDKLSEPGSKQRNGIIAGIFHDLGYAETKGTGIAAMRDWMREAGLTTPPIIETSRESNEFDLVLLPYHLLDRTDLHWLSQFNKFNLSDAERRALVLVREMGAITNQDYRQINGVETLAASKALCHLRDQGLLQMKGGEKNSYYVLNEEIAKIHKKLSEVSYPTSNADDRSVLSLSGMEAPRINSLSGMEAPRINSLPEEQAFFENSIPLDLKEKIAALNKRSSRTEVESLIKRACAIKPLRLDQLAKLLNRSPRHLREHYISKMVKCKELEYLYPKVPRHMKQAYKTPTIDEKK